MFLGSQQTTRGVHQIPSNSVNLELQFPSPQQQMAAKVSTQLFGITEAAFICFSEVLLCTCTTKDLTNSLRGIHSRCGICGFSYFEDSSSLRFSSQIATTVRAPRSDWSLQSRKAVAFCWDLPPLTRLTGK